jgi:intermediate cleaving peptidase 55
MAACRSLVRQCAVHLRSSRPLSHSLRQLPRFNLPRSYATSVAAAELKFGQPLHETHPHILSPGERV